jgi:acetyltransferase-like isoleucine patch superfamily enzyme
LGDRTEIHCGRNVKIGNHVAISWDCVIMESDYHAAGGSEVVPRPIVIEDEAWIGCRVIILKGVTVGRGAIVGAGSVVTKDVPPYTLAAGNPARVIKPVEPWTGKEKV